MTPTQRGFDTSLGFLGASEDHFTQRIKLGGCEGVDLWHNDTPAIGYNGTYSADIYSREIQRILTVHHAAQDKRPLFLYVALQIMHGPHQAPQQYIDFYLHQNFTEDYANYNAMSKSIDDIVGNLTRTLKQLHMWKNTLIIYASDNGGESGLREHRPTKGVAGNNWPLRGGKFTFWEGGVRTVAFAAGGLIPRNMRNRTLTGYIHECDWYATFVTLAGGNVTDKVPMHYPSVDGLNMWPYISGDVQSSPRTEMFLGTDSFSMKLGASKTSEKMPNGAMIDGDYKFIYGSQRHGFWQGPIYPNKSADATFQWKTDTSCRFEGCLFNIQVGYLLREV